MLFTYNTAAAGKSLHTAAKNVKKRCRPAGLGLAPLCPGCARVLVLGSMPSEKSIAAGFYYANPRNAFWPILAALYGEADEGTPEGRIARLGAHGVALWDSAASCFRRGSLDSAIRDQRHPRLPRGARGHPRGAVQRPGLAQAPDARIPRPGGSRARPALDKPRGRVPLLCGEARGLGGCV